MTAVAVPTGVVPFSDPIVASGRHAGAFATTAALEAMPANRRAHGMMAVVLSGSTAWIYDTDSTASAGAKVLEPDDAPATGRWVQVEAAGSEADILALLAGTGDDQGAELIGLRDAAGFTTAVNVEAAAAELYQNALTAQGWIDLPLDDWRETDAAGAVGNIAANGGKLASDTTPVLGASSKSWILTWATGNVDPIGIQKSLPPDFNGAADAVLELDLASGTTDAANFGVESMWDGGTAVADTADDAATKSATVHTVAVTIAAADITPDTARRLTILLTPPAHATDTIVLAAARLKYKKKLLAS